ncbi:unnamed protein product [Gadus morhua 'NCC']
MEDCDDFGDRSTQRGAALDSLHVDAPGSSHMSSHKGELRILNVYGKGEGPLALDGHDTLFTTFKLEAQDSLLADHSVVKSLESGEQLVHREELTGHRGGGKGRPGLQAISGGTESSTSRESARRKRELCTIVGESAAINDAAGATPTSEPEDDGDGDTSTMDPEPVVVHRGSQCNIRCFHRSLEDCDDFGDCSTQRDATSESLYAPGSSHMSSHNEELSILNVYGKGEGPLALDGHDTLVSELEALNSLSADHSVVKSLVRGEQLVRREELTGQQQTPDTISIKDEEDIDGGMPALDCDDFGDCSTQHSAALDSLHVDAPGSSHMSGHKGELRILNVYGKGEGPLALDGNDALFTASKLETLNSLSADHREELTVQQTPDTISIKEEEDIDWGMPAVG